MIIYNILNISVYISDNNIYILQGLPFTHANTSTLATTIPMQPELPSSNCPKRGQGGNLLTKIIYVHSKKLKMIQ